MDSFYGGKQGVSFVLKGHFNYISPEKDAYIAEYNRLQNEEGMSADEATAALKPKTMTECFNDTGYKEIWYNEFCIIDTVNKSDKDNGKVFRRTLKGPSDEIHIGGVSEYIGQIVGPAGPAPLLEVGGVDSTHTLWQNQEIGSGDFIEYYDLSGNKRNDKPLGVDLKVFSTGANGTINLVPGSTIEDAQAATPAEQYVHDLKYNWYQFVEGGAEDGDPARIYIGFDFPYYEADFYAGRALNYTSAPILSKTLDAVFYDQYTLDVPRGITGGHFKDFYRITKTNEDDVYGTDIISYDAEHDTYEANEEAEPLSGLDNKDIWITYFYWYSPDGEENKLDYKIYVGTIQDIESITEIAADGSFTVNYTDGNSQTYDKALSWITSVNIDEHRNLSFTANNDVLQAHLPEPFNLRTITNTSLIGDVHNYETEQPSDKNANRKIHIAYSDNTSQYIGDEINYIQKFYYAQPGDIHGLPAYHAYVLFNAASHRYDPEREDYEDFNPSEWVDIYNNGIYWLDLGYMRQVDQGLVAQTQITSQYDNIADAIQYELNVNYPYGLNSPNEGKLIGVLLPNNDVYLVAYDYDNYTWFSIGNLSGATLDTVIDGAEDSSKGKETTVWLHPSTDKTTPKPMSTPWSIGGVTRDTPIGDYARLAFLGAHQGWDLDNDILDNPKPEPLINPDENDEKEKFVNSTMNQIRGD